MCLSSPNIPEPAPPPQEAKPADSMAQRRAGRRSGLRMGTVLTGPAGVAPGASNTGGNTLLGG